MRQAPNQSGIGDRQPLLAIIAILAALAMSLASFFALGVRSAAAQDDASKYLTPKEQQQLAQAAQQNPEAIGIVTAKASKDPDVLNFGDVGVGTDSAVQNVTVTADSKGCVDTFLFGCVGDFNVNINSATATGDFTKVSDTCSGQELSVGATCTIGVQFHPDTLGPKSGSLTISPGSDTFEILGVGLFTVATEFNDGNTVSLSGTGKDITKPRVISFSPTGNAVSPRANVAATFSEAMNQGTLNSNTVKLVKKGTNTKVGGALKFPAPNKVILDPNKLLKSGVSYTATITTGAQDVAGNPLAAQKSFSFKVK